LLERVNRPQTLGFQADMAHTLLYILGYNASEDAILPANWDWSDPGRLDEAMKTLTQALRPWTNDFHVAQNDATVKGSGSHDKTGHHCLPNDPDGKLKIAHHAGYWLHGDDGKLTKALRHICWDGCMFPNAVMMKQETWNDILGAMISVRDAHGWREEKTKEAREAEVTVSEPIEVRAKPSKPAAPIPAKAAPKKAKAPATKKAVKKPAKKAAPKKPAKKVRAKTSAKAKLKSKPRKKKRRKRLPKLKSQPAKSPLSERNNDPPISRIDAN